MGGAGGPSPWLAAGAVAVGAMFGSLLRWVAASSFNAPAQWFPLGTLVVNCVGGLLIGVVMVALGRHPSELGRLFAVTGFLGGLTTFSAFSAESLVLLQRGEWAIAALHVLAHVIGALAAAALGFAIGDALLR